MSSIQQINEAFIDAFDINTLTRVVKYGLDADLDKLDGVSIDGDFARTVFQLINWAIKNNRLPRLLQEAKGHTQNPLIQELEYIPRKIQTRDVSSSIGRGLMENRENLEYLIFQISQLTSELSLVKKILTGSEGNNGVRRTSEDNARSIADVMRILEKMEMRQGNMMNDISSLQRDIIKLQTAISMPPNLFSDWRSKIGVSILGIMIVGVFIMVALQMLGG